MTYDIAPRRISTRVAVVTGAVAITSGMMLTAAEPTWAGFCGTNGLITYTSDGVQLHNDDIYVTDETGTTHIRLTVDPDVEQQSAMSPNGKEIVFFSQRDTAEFPNAGRDSELYVMDAADDQGTDGPDGQGDNLRRLTDNAAPDFGATWSPDGRKIAFTSNRDGNNEIYVMDADGAEAVNLTNSPLRDRFPRFSPDGARIVFQRTDPGGNEEIYMMDADGGNLTNVSNHPALDSIPDFSPDGQKLTFGSTRPSDVPGDIPGDVDIWVMNLNGTGLENLTPSRNSTNDRWSRWSPDGQKIVFWSGAANGLGPDADIYTMNATDGGSLTNVTSSPGAGDAFPDWGPARQHPDDPPVTCNS